MAGKVGLNGFPNGHCAFKIGFHGGRQIIQGHGMTLNTLVDAMVENQDITASLHPGMLSQEPDFAEVRAIHLDRKCIIATFTDGIDDHLGRF
jgi:hypothetical protein